MISRSGTRKSSDANVLAVKQGFDFAQRPTGLLEVFRLPLRMMWVMTRVSTLVVIRRNAFIVTVTGSPAAALIGELLKELPQGQD